MANIKFSKINLQPKLNYFILLIILIAVGLLGINLYRIPNHDEISQVQNNNSYLEQNQAHEQTTSTVTTSSQDTINSEITDSITNTSSPSEELIVEVPDQNTAVSEKISSKEENTSKDETTKEEKSTSSPTTTISSNNETTSESNSSQISDSTPESTTPTTYEIIDITTIETNSATNQSQATTSKNTTNSTTDNVTKSDTSNIIEVQTSSSTTTSKASQTETNETLSSSTTSNNSSSTTQEASSTTKTTTSSSSTTKNSTSTSTTVLTTNVKFNNITNCTNNKTVKKVKATNGSTIEIKECIAGYKIDNKSYMMQNFAITDKYVYFSFLRRGTWVKTEAKYQELGARKSLQQTSANYIVRIDKATNTYQLNYVEYAGHAQSFDVTTNDRIYLNYFSKLYKGGYGYGARYVGLTSITFTENTKKAGVEVVPEQAISVNSTGTALSILKSKKYQVGDTFDSTKYYDQVVSIGASSNKMLNPELAIDEKNNRLALVSGKTAYIYNLKKFMAGQADILKKFTLATSSKQGVEIADGYLYLWSGTDNFTLRKYNLSTGKLVNQISFDLKNYYDDSAEGEGLNIYNGQVYIGISSNVKNCNEIFLVKNF